MGVHSLWKLLEPAAGYERLESLAGRRLAVDASIWLHQFLKAMRDSEGNGLRGAHIIGFFRRICKLLFYGIKPIFVFDGVTPPLKRLTVAGRRKRHQDAGKSVQKTAEKLLHAQMRLHALNTNNSKKKTGSNESSSPGNVNYMDESDHYQERSQKSSNFTAQEFVKAAGLASKRKREDDYQLPTISEIQSSVSLSTDPRLADEKDLRSFINEHKHSIDFNSIDFDSKAFSEFPVELQYQIILDLKTHSREASSTRVAELLQAPKPIDFSILQIRNLVQRNTLTEKLFHIAKTGGVSVNPAMAKRQQTLDKRKNRYQNAANRIASVKGREYVLVKNDDAAGGGHTMKMMKSETWKIVENGKIVTPSATATMDNNMHESSDDFKDEEFFEVDVNDTEQVPKSSVNNMPLFSDSDSEPDTHHIDHSIIKTDDHVDDSESVESIEEKFAILESIQTAPSKSNPTTIFTEESAILPTLSESAALDNFKETQSSSESNISLNMNIENHHHNSDKYDDVEKNYESHFDVLKSNTFDNIDSLFEFWKNQVPDDMDVIYPNYIENMISICEENDIDSLQLQISQLEKRLMKIPEAEVWGPKYIATKYISCFLESRIELMKKKSEASQKNTFHSSTSSSELSPTQKVNEKSTDAMKEIKPDNAIIESAQESLNKATNVLSQNSITNSSSNESVPQMNESKSNKHLIQQNHNNNAQRNISTQFLIQSIDDNNIVTQLIKTNNLPPKPNVDHQNHINITQNENEHNTTAQLIDSSLLSTEISNTNEQLPMSEANTDQNEGQKFTTQSDAITSVPETDSFQSIKLLDQRDNNVRAEDDNIMVENDDDDCQDDVNLFGEDEIDDLVGIAPVSDQEDEAFSKFVAEVSDRGSEQVAKDIENELADLLLKKRRETRDAATITGEMIRESQTLLQLCGLPYIVAPTEAESQCAWLRSSSLVDGIVTDDSDVFLFGGSHVYKNVFNVNKYVESYTSQKLQDSLSLDRKTLILLAYLLGSDYTEGIKGIGVVTAMEIIKEWENCSDDIESSVRKELHCLILFRNWVTSVQMGEKSQNESAFQKKFRKRALGLDIPDSFPDPRVYDAYFSPEVDTSTQEFAWGKPDLIGIRNFLEEKTGQPQSKTDEILIPVIREMNKRTTEPVQTHISQFFSGISTKPHQSQRIQRVVESRKSAKAQPETVLSLRRGKRGRK